MEKPIGGYEMFRILQDSVSVSRLYNGWMPILYRSTVHPEAAGVHLSLVLLAIDDVPILDDEDRLPRGGVVGGLHVGEAEHVSVQHDKQSVLLSQTG